MMQLTAFWCAYLAVFFNLSFASTLHRLGTVDSIPSASPSPSRKLSSAENVTQDFSLEWSPALSLDDDSFFGDFENGRDGKENTLLRTWRVNKKALMPILIGIAVKSLAIIPIVLTGLTIMGTLAILISKVSLAISAVMFLRRYFGHDASSGGFFGLNPLNYPQGALSPHDHHPGYGNRRTTFNIRGRSNMPNKGMSNILQRLEEAEEKYRHDAAAGNNELNVDDENNYNETS